MFAHQVIEDMRYWYRVLHKRKVAIALCDRVKNIPSEIKKAQHFHLGGAHTIWSFGSHLEGNQLFMNDMGDVRLPFEHCWFDFNKDYETDSMVPVSHRYQRGGILVKQIKPDLLWMDIIVYMNELQHWTLMPQGYVIAIDKTISEHSGVVEWGLEGVRSVGGDTNKVLSYFKSVNIAPIPYLDPKEFASDRQMQEDTDEASLLNVTLMLLGCKNVVTEKNIPDPIVNKKRTKKGNQPLFTYHTLSLKPVGKHQESVPKHLWENRIHLARGHFKTFTPDKPLFGKITGRFWWQPQVRGRNTKGMIMKDYALDAKDFESVPFTGDQS